VIAMDKFNAWVMFCEKLPQKVDEFGQLPPPEIDGLAQDIHVLRLALTARSRGRVIGAIPLAKAGMVVDARTLVRNIFEKMFYIARLITEGGTFVQQVMEADLVSRDRRGQFMLERPSTIIDVKVPENPLDGCIPMQRFVRATPIVVMDPRRDVRPHRQHLGRSQPRTPPGPFAALARAFRSRAADRSEPYGPSIRRRWTLSAKNSVPRSVWTRWIETGSSNTWSRNASVAWADRRPRRSGQIWL
jgi:hypothetical protein